MSTLAEFQSQGYFENIDLDGPIDQVNKILDKFSNHPLGLILLYPQLWKELVRLNKNLSRLEQKIPLMKFETYEEQRISEILPGNFLILSGVLFKCAEQISSVAENSNWKIFQYIHNKVINLMEDIACSLEDYAEILVLVSNKVFLKEIEREFEAVETKTPTH